MNYNQLGIIILGLVCMGAALGFERSLLPRMAVEVWNIHSSTTVLYLVSTFGASKAFANVIAGPLADTYGRKPTLILGFVVGLPVMPYVIFAEALTDPVQYKHFTGSLAAPVLANMTEFGKTPLMSTAELREVGVRLVLYPLSAFRAMSRAAEQVFRAIRQDGGQANVVDSMQTREELYDVLDYLKYEQTMDSILEKGTP